MARSSDPPAPLPLHARCLTADTPFQQLLEQLPTAAYTCDADGLITYFNPQAQAIWGRAPKLGDADDRFCGSFRLFAVDGAPIVHADSWMALAVRQRRSFNGCEAVIERPDGSRVHALAHANPILGRDGELLGAVNVLVDISERNQLEAERRERERQDQQERLGSLAGGVAHDLNNLLTGVLGNIDLAARTLAQDAPALALLQQAQRAAQQAAQLSRQMLAYSGRGRLAIEPVRLDAMVAATVPALRAALPAAVAIDCQLQPAPVLGDLAQLRQAVLDLVACAAARLGERAGSIQIATGTRADGDGSCAFVRIVDDGEPLPAEQLAALFEPYRAPRPCGRGLGLAAVDGSVRGHGGRVVAHGEAGGTVVELLLPLAAAAPESAAPLPLLAGTGPVLVVDDDDCVRGLIQRALERDGHETLIAASGAEALDLFAGCGGEVSLAIVDLSMHGMNGLDLLERLRALRPGLPVLVVSGYSEQAVQPQRHGVELLSKPFLPDELLLRVRALLGG